jgi:Spy/CpxP family protein refolding chaperone
MSKKILLGILVILTVVNLSALGTFLYHRFKSPSRPCLSERAGTGFEILKRELSLSPEQTKLIEKLRLSFHEGIDALSKRQEVVRRDLVRELMKEKPDPDRLSGCVESINDLQLQAQNRVVEQLLAVKEVLTDAQREKFFSLVLERIPSPDGKHAPGAYLRGAGRR